MRHSGAQTALRCSFCGKDQSVVSKLFSSPSDRPSSFICDECIRVCESILEDERGYLEPDAFDDETPGERNPLLDHPLASRLLAAVERWIVQESLGGADAAKEFAEMRSTAIRLIQQSNMK
jgi:ATP-dependent protease Clp ATPase subunit